ncbi:hypothetical protein, variant 1 [Aphanomyces invadans]|uniref:P-type ATPase A domain-containing protein n=1 Tax=Aphanomyces invadans TaxID=157072 RepID=A0A024TLB3_9STRA|nr:hypothetical protein, variant 1 [Aphanomyces invadans]ETV94386.1 hypothetical protein, variant 1 [Aphanomyces invadans]|eukprot:XP_008877147.1 hypothetical protein, variant 1 [Aphanomyces invadans]
MEQRCMRSTYHGIPETITSCHHPTNDLVSQAAIPCVWFNYQKLRFCVYATTEDSKASSIVFHRLDYPTAHVLEHYTSSQGYLSIQDVNEASARWQENEFDIPIPEFWELLKQHLVAPFFVFQFFCMLLWCLDEYMYYSLFTLAMLVLFECTLVKQRQHNMGLLRQMRRPPVRMYVYRMKKWTEITSRSLLPGDICSIGRSKPIYRGQDMTEPIVPCEMLLLHGGCVVNEAMLSGESIPLRKEALDVAHYDANTKLNVDETNLAMKKHILYGGTKVLQFTNNVTTVGRLPSIPDPPEKGCIAFVLRTGFGTTQGNLMRTILFSAPRVTANNKESMLFILFLLCFAVLAAGTVLQQGLNDPTRNTFKLFLHCVMIITSVVPPELPMELSLAVTNSLLSLTKLSIFCTEPFRIPFAGKVDVVCFDKTGTLTSDALEMHGVAGLQSTSLVALEDPQQLVAPAALPTSIQLILAGCHSLMALDGKVVGDPLETTIMSHVKWSLRPGDVMLPHLSFVPGPKSMKIVHRYAFSAELKRMSSIVVLGSSTESDSLGVKLLSKGAPEVMESLFASIPDYYTRVYKHYALKGCRVLALGSKALSTRDLQRLKTIARSEMEKNLEFGGFLVLDCPVKHDTTDVIQELKTSKHVLVMITGDNALTALDVAKQIQLASHLNTLILQPSKTKEDALVWVDPRFDKASTKQLPFESNQETMASLAASTNLCVTGDALTLLTPAQLQLVVRHACVFARTSPSQKEAILDALNQCGFVTAMCGDGTNDVGALKRAHVGISIINNPDQPTTTPTEPSSSHVVKFGDASIASPFTSKQPSIRATCQILCQGRCTLVTTLQMYKILGINCLLSAYVLSSLYMYGVKQGDMQMTVVGVVIALFYLFLSYAKPCTRLSARRPLTRVFCLSVLLSMGIQFVVHLATLAAALDVALPFVDMDDPAMHPEAKFRPNVLNSIVFVVSLHMQINTFVVNYHGAPFMQSFHDNRYLAKWTYLSYSLVLIALWEVFPPINDLLELAFLPSFETQVHVTILLALDTVAVLGLEAGLQYLTARYPALMA